MEEILMDILSRLPVKSVIRFNCVSKFWNTLISQPYFKTKHLNHAKNQLNSQNTIFCEWDPNWKFWSYSVSSVKEDIPIFDCISNSNPIVSMHIYCSCDGLFLIGIWTERHAEQPSILVLWNPSTKQSIRLPHTKFSLQMQGDEMEEDDERGSTYGLAYDSTSDDYKVFRIEIFTNEDNEILALKNGSWRIIDGKTSGRTYRNNRLLFMGGEFLAFVDGAFHWLGFILPNVCVVSFNISDEMYGEISLPEMLSSQLSLFQFDNVKVQVDVHVGLSVLRGMLGVYYKEENNNFNLWVMKKYGCWMKLLSIPTRASAGAGFYRIIPKYAFSDNEVLLCFDQETWITPNRVKKEFIYQIVICSGSSDRMFSEEYYNASTMDHEGEVYTETLIFPKLGH